MKPENELASHPGLRLLLETGAREGRVSYQFLNQTLGDLSLDDESAEDLLEVLENRGIQIVDEAPLASQVAPAKTPKIAKIAKPKKAGPNSDLDDVLASLEELMNSPLGELLARDEAAESEDPEEESSALEDSFTQYMNRMGHVPLLEIDDEKRLANLARSGTENEKTEAKQKLVEANLRLVVSIAKRYDKRASMPLIDLVQEGNIGLMRAVDKWNPSRGDRLASYATWYIRESINRAIAAQARAIRLPGHLGAAVQKLQRLQRELSQQLGRAPSIDDLATAAGMTHAQVQEALRTAAEPLSLESPVGDDENSSLGDILAATEDSPLEEISRGELHEAIEFALENLSAHERNVVQQRFGLGDFAGVGARSEEDVARSMNLSRERVHELEIRALRKMRRRTRGTALEGLFDGDNFDD